MNFVALRTELLTDPLTRGYSGMTDAEAADDLNTNMRDIDRTVSVDDVRQYLVTQINGTGVDQRNVLDMVREYAQDGTVRGVALGTEVGKEGRMSFAQMIWFMLSQGGFEAAFPVDNTDVRNQFIALGGDGGDGPGLFTTAQLQAIDALAVSSVSRAQELGLGTARPGDVNMARVGMG